MARTTRIPTPGLELRGMPRGWRLEAIGYATPDTSLRDGVAGSFLLAVAPGVDALQAVKLAAIDYTAHLDAEAAKGEATVPDHPLNWGDVRDGCPPEILHARGVLFIDLPTAIVHGPVDHDELLARPRSIR